MEIGPAIVGLLVCLFIIVMVFLVGREVMLWYWKINPHLELLHALLDEQKRTNELLVKGFSIVEADKKPEDVQSA